MAVVQAPPGAVPFVKIGRHSSLQIAVYTEAIRVKNEALENNNWNLLPMTSDLVSAVRSEYDATEDEVIQAIEELRGDATLFMLPNGRLRYDSYDSY